MTGRDDLAEPAAVPTPTPDAPIAPPSRAVVPLPLVARMVARLVGGQETAATDIPVLVETVSAALEQILYPAPPAPAADLQESEAPVRNRPRRDPRQAEGARKPGRPRKSETIGPVEAASAPLPAPRLVRRAEAAVTTSAAEPTPLAPPTNGMVKGVVRWFDPVRQTGGLRLTGVPEDVGVEPPVFVAAGVTRLFKGQEIEAQIDRGEGRVRVTALRIPGGPVTAPTASGAIAAMGGRKPRMVIVEKKRDALKRVAARTEAEHLLGPAGAPKPQR